MEAVEVVEREMELGVLAEVVLVMMVIIVYTHNGRGGCVWRRGCTLLR